MAKEKRRRVKAAATVLADAAEARFLQAWAADRDAATKLPAAAKGPSAGERMDALRRRIAVRAKL